MALMALPVSEPAMIAAPPEPALPSTADALEQYDLLLAECAALLANDGLLNPADVPERFRLVPLDSAASPPLPHACTPAPQPSSQSVRSDAQGAQPEVFVPHQQARRGTSPQHDASPLAKPPPYDEAAGPSGDLDEAVQCKPTDTDPDGDSEALVRELPTPDAKHVRAANRALRDRLRTLAPANVNSPKQEE